MSDSNNIIKGDRPSGRLPATKDDIRAVSEVVKEAAAGEKFVSWISSGVGALVSIVGVVATLVGGSFFLLDRAEAAAGKPAAVVQQNLDDHKQFEALNHQWTQTMLLRGDDKMTALLRERRVPDPTPASPPAPPALFQTDGGYR